MYEEVRTVGILRKFLTGSLMLVGFLALAAIVPLWPITAPLFIFFGIAGFIRCLGYMGETVCPACGSKITVLSKQGGTRCKACKSSLVIRHGWIGTAR